MFLNWDLGGMMERGMNWPFIFNHGPLMAHSKEVLGLNVQTDLHPVLGTLANSHSPKTCMLGLV